MSLPWNFKKMTCYSPERHPEFFYPQLLLFGLYHMRPISQFGFFSFGDQRTKRLLITCIRLAIVPLVQNSLMTFMRTQVSHHYQLRGFDTIEKLMTILMTLSNRQWRTRGLVSTSLLAARCDIHVCCINKGYVYIIGLRVLSLKSVKNLLMYVMWVTWICLR